MANVAFLKNGKVQYLESVNTGEYVVDPNAKKDQVVPKENVVINPDISSFKDVDKKYWKIEFGALREMTPQEKQEVDTAEADEKDKAKERGEGMNVAKLVKVLLKKGIIDKGDFD